MGLAPLGLWSNYCNKMAVLLETSIGDIVIDLFVQDRPKCSLNFLKLCKLKFYNFCLFHSVQRNFIAQSGDPTGTGEGGTSVWGVVENEKRFFDSEVVPKKKHVNPGTVSMVSDGNNQHGSQFLITLGADLDHLDGKHTVFGEVAEGDDVLAKLNEAYCDDENRPYQDICILHTIILDDPFDDLPGMVVPERSPSPPAMKKTERIAFDEDINDFEGKTEEEIREIIESRDARANAEILEIVGDIPDADAKPPENVLFVCKLNPATTSEDLEVIFSRFGNILSCEVIRDQKTKDSLQYAFIEFEREEDCLDAYFKMDNVLIDDRRIHVDFSQSLAKVKGLAKQYVAEKSDKSKQKDDGLAFRKKYAHTDSKYDLLFDDESSKVSHSHQGKTNTHPERYHKGSSSRDVPYRREREKERSHRHRSRSRSSSRDVLYKREREKERSHRQRSRSRSEERSRRRDRSRERRRERSRSRSRERKAYRTGSSGKPRRQRSNSRDRDRYHRGSYSKH